LPSWKDLESLIYERLTTSSISFQGLSLLGERKGGGKRETLGTRLLPVQGDILSSPTNVDEACGLRC